MTNKFIIILTFIAAVGLSCGEKEISLPYEYTSDQRNVKFNYNDNWEIEENNQGIGILSTIEQDSTAFTDNVTVAVIPKDPQLDFYTHIGANKRYILLNQGEIIEEEIIEVNNELAYRVIIDKEMEGNDYRILQYLQLIDHTSYVITFIGKSETYEEKVTEAELIMKSMVFDQPVVDE